jgi:hypothetical protein
MCIISELHRFVNKRSVKFHVSLLYEPFVKLSASYRVERMYNSFIFPIHTSIIIIGLTPSSSKPFGFGGTYILKKSDLKDFTKNSI